MISKKRPVDGWANPRETKGQTMAEYALVLAGLALVAYGLSPTSGYNFLDNAIMALLAKVTSLF